jgi:hypothetical protein
MHERVRDAVLRAQEGPDSLLSFLTRLRQFGMLSGTPPLLASRNGSRS